MDFVVSPGRSLTRREQKRATRDRVIAAARLVFNREGYDAATIRMIADEAGVSAGSVFTTFSSKAELLHEVAAANVASVVEIFRSQAANPGVSARDQLRDGFCEVGRRSLTQIRLIASMAAGSWNWSPEHQGVNANEFWASRFGLAYEAAKSIIRAGQARGEIRSDASPGLVVDLIQAAFISNLRLVAVGTIDGDALTSRIREQIDLIFDGLAAPA